MNSEELMLYDIIRSLLLIIGYVGSFAMILWVVVKNKSLPFYLVGIALAIIFAVLTVHYLPGDPL